MNKNTFLIENFADPFHNDDIEVTIVTDIPNGWHYDGDRADKEGTAMYQVYTDLKGNYVGILLEN